MKDEGRAPHGREDVADVSVHHHAMEGHRFRGARAPARVPDVPVDEALVMRLRRHVAASSVSEVVAITPVLRHLAERGGRLLLRWSPGIVGCPKATRGRLVHHERIRALGVRCRKEHGEPGAFLARPKRGAVRPDRVQHSPHVVHPGLERRAARSRDRRDRCRACRRGSPGRTTRGLRRGRRTAADPTPPGGRRACLGTNTMSIGPSPTT